MKEIFAIRKDEIYPRFQWQERFKKNPELLTSEKYSYTLVEVTENVDYKKVRYNHFINNQFSLDKYNADIITTEEKMELEELEKERQQVLLDNSFTDDFKKERYVELKTKVDTN